ncbi:hypothetical protein [Azomonas macrocytogenes]|uniref:Uncharacterized protein n=1 Tax=Azomonas macrocytogenes TaxID=69962 RepID=A0A839T766_AZOMA|nr:hypothetical protein [Azomonas macrocytogenes]MBB3105347.1 hypothetical protein [Azomonas macrocytogenes]
MTLFRWLKTSALWYGLGLVVLMIATALLVQHRGSALVGGVNAWDQWREAAYPYLLAWRVLLYVLLARSWLWMRQREPTAEAKVRLQRIEVSVVLTVALFELMKSGLI